MKRHHSLVGGAVIALLVSCGTNGPGAFELAPVPATPPSLMVEVGTGYASFEPIADGDPVPLTYGAQGGFHIWTSVRVTGAVATNAQVNLAMRFEDGAAAGPASRSAAALEPDGQGALTAAGLRNFVGEAALVRGKRVTLRAEVIAADQRHGAGERVVTAQ